MFMTNPIAARIRKTISGKNDSIKIEIAKPTWMIHERLIKEAIPIDISAMTLLQVGVKRSLGKAILSNELFLRPPRDEVERLKLLDHEMDNEISESEKDVDDKVSRLMRYEEDYSIIEYYIDCIDISIKKMKEMSDLERRNNE